MLAVFCLRLTAGMIACLLVLPAGLINPRFYRTHFLTALGLTALAWCFIPAGPESFVWPLRLVLGASLALTFAGSFVWSLDKAPAGRTMIVLATLALTGSLALVEISAAGKQPWLDGQPLQNDASSIAPVNLAGVLVGAFTSAALLGAGMTAMLMGHSYLVAPSMSLIPLLRLIALFAGAVGIRMGIEGYRFWWWTQRHALDSLGNDTLLWLPVRWGIGLLLPLGLAWMAWQTTRIRSTQSSTGILYVVVLFVFLGELTSLLLREKGVTL